MLALLSGTWRYLSIYIHTLQRYTHGLSAYGLSPHGCVHGLSALTGSQLTRSRAHSALTGSQRAHGLTARSRAHIVVSPLGMNPFGAT